MKKHEFPLDVPWRHFDRHWNAIRGLSVIQAQALLSEWNGQGSVLKEGRKRGGAACAEPLEKAGWPRPANQSCGSNRDNSISHFHIAAEKRLRALSYALTEVEGPGHLIKGFLQDMVTARGVFMLVLQAIKRLATD